VHSRATGVLVVCSVTQRRSSPNGSIRSKVGASVLRRSVAALPARKPRRVFYRSSFPSGRLLIHFSVWRVPSYGSMSPFVGFQILRWISLVNSSKTTRQPSVWGWERTNHRALGLHGCLVNAAQQNALRRSRREGSQHHIPTHKGWLYVVFERNSITRLGRALRDT
jgi:hypothetical protein